MIQAWEVCLVTGIGWETYWTLTGSEMSALVEAHGNVERRKNRK